MFSRALISVSDKSGLDHLVAGLKALPLMPEVLSTGGTAARLRELGVEVVDIADYTGFPEAFGGRLKTLHPKIHGGILYRRGVDDADAAQLGVLPIDLVVVNLYPFAQTYQASQEPDLWQEQIDIGGPTMVRAAAKNCQNVAILVHPEDYQPVLEQARQGELSPDIRNHLRKRAFAHTAGYDAQIAAAFEEEPFPARISLALTRQSELRYGENPHQKAAFYRLETFPPRFRQLHGKALSYNNLLDFQAAVMPLASDKVRCCVVKHAAPCGLAEASTSVQAFELAWGADDKSAFGSVVAFSAEVDKATAEAFAGRFVEAIAAPKFTAEALEVLEAKKNLRLLELPNHQARIPASYGHQWSGQGAVWLAQQPDRETAMEIRSVTTKPFPEDKRGLAEFAMTAARCLKSNAIALAAVQEGAFVTLGLGGGQPNRVDAVDLAVRRADQDLSEAVLASDAFFPFPDNIEIAAQAGIKTIVQPGGSVRDEEVIAACNRLGVAMAFTGRRGFRH